MGVVFVIGRAGSGKTSHCFDQIVEALRSDPLGPPTYWLLPKQATFIAEHHLTCASGLGGFCRARVLSFEQLAGEVLAECGGAAVPEVTSLGRQMILGHLLRKHEQQLRFFSSVARHPGLAARLDATLTEFDRCGRDPEQLQALIVDMTGGRQPQDEPDPLADKLHDLHLIYRAYNDYIGQDRLDPRRRMEQVLKCVNDSHRLRRATIYVDGFSDFTDFERRLLVRLARICPRVEIALLLDPDLPVVHDHARAPEELSLFHRHEQTLQRLMSALTDDFAVVEPPLLLRACHRFRSPALAAVERSLFVERPSPIESPSAAEPAAVTLVEAPDRRAEVEHAARHVRRLLATGLRLRDIAVLVRRLDLYHSLISATFREHELPCFIDQRRTMAHHPLLQFLRSALAVALHHWPHDAVMLLLKTGLAGLSIDEADRLENYVLEHHLRGSVWTRAEPWQWHRHLAASSDDVGATSDQPEQLGEIDSLRRRIADPIAAFITHVTAANRLPLRRIVVEIFRLVDRFGLRETLSRWIGQARAGQDHEQAEEHRQVWEEIVRLFDQMVDLLGDEPVTLSDFNDILESALETFDLALAPPTVDEVLVGQIDRTRTPDARAVLLLGLNEGIFPAALRETSILSDAERIELQSHRFDTDPGAERRLLDENLLGYIAFTRASERLYISRSLADDAGRPLAPSPFWHRLRRLMPDLPVTILPRDDRTDPALISTPRQLLTGLMRWVRTRAGEAALDAHGSASASGAWPGLYQWLAEYQPRADAIDNIRYRAWKALSYDNSASLSSAIAAELFARPLVAGVSQIETFATCPFKHFLRYGLHLHERPDQEHPSIDLDRALHQIMDELGREVLRGRADWNTLTPERSRQLVREYAEKLAESLRGELMLSSARNRYLLGRIERTLERVIANQQAIAQRGEFRTAHAGVHFGDGPRGLPPLAITTPDGHQLHLTGRIDRIDLLEQQAAFAILDYRLHGGELNFTRIWHGLSLQLLASLLVIQAHGEKLAGRKLTPAAAFYVRLLRQLEKVAHPSESPEPDDPMFHLRGKQRGIFDGRYFRALDNDPESTASAVVSARLKKDGTFGHKANTDVAESDELRALLEQVRGQIGRLGDQILAGDIDIAPYRIHTQSPCPSCQYRSACRFDPALNHYHQLTPIRRDEALRAAVEATGPLPTSPPAAHPPPQERRSRRPSRPRKS